MRESLCLLVLCFAASVRAEQDLPCSPVIARAPKFTIKFDSESLHFPQLGMSEFSRSTPATFFDAVGVMRTAPPNQPRIDYHPFLCENPDLDTLREPSCRRRLRGLLIEEKRTNSILYSNDFTHWVANGVSVKKDIAGPDLTQGSASKITLDGVSGSIETTATIRKGSSFVFSVYVKDTHPALAFERRSPPRPPIMKFHFIWRGQEISTGDIDVRAQYVLPGNLTLAETSGNNRFSEVEPVTRGWYRVWASLDYKLLKNRISLDGDQPVRVRIELNKKDLTSSSVTLWGAQFENGRFPLSLIPTNGAAATRDSDRLKITPHTRGKSFDWSEGVQGNFTVQAEVADAQSMPAGYLTELGYENGDRQIMGIEYGRAYHLMYYWKPLQHLLKYKSGYGLLNSGEPFKLSFGYLKSGDGSLYLRHTIDGGEVQRPPTLYTGPVPKGLRYILIGGGINPKYNRSLNGHILGMTFWDSILSLEEQRRVTSLGCKPQVMPILPAQASLSDDCQGNDILAEEKMVYLPRRQKEASVWMLNDKWVVNNLCKFEGHILSRRCHDSVKVEADYCKLVTERTNYFDASGNRIWKTGSASTLEAIRYGYFESAFKNDGIEPTQDIGLNNAFWLWTVSPAQLKSPDEIDCEADINEGLYPNLVRMTLHKHRAYQQTPTVIWSAANSRSWRHPLPASDPNSLSKRDHVYSLTWNRQEFSWYVDNQLVRKTPNYFCHRDAFVYMSSAIMKKGGGSTGVIPDDMEGKHLQFKYIRTYPWK